MPIREYAQPLGCENPESSGKVRIEIRSCQNDLTDTGFFGVPGGQSQPEVLEDLMPAELFDSSWEDDWEEDAPAIPEEDDTYTLISEGTLKLEDERLTLSYVESALTDMEGCVTTISFSPDEPTCVTITRSGSVSAAFVIQERVRQFSVYRTPYGPIEMCVYGKKVKNTLSFAGGELLLDYAVELKGMTTQRTKMTIRVSPTGENS